MNKTTEVWCFGRGGKLILSADVRDMEHARSLAREWNRSNKLSEIEIISNALRTAESTLITAV